MCKYDALYRYQNYKKIEKSIPNNDRKSRLHEALWNINVIRFLIKATFAYSLANIALQKNIEYNLRL